MDRRLPWPTGGMRSPRRSASATGLSRTARWSALPALVTCLPAKLSATASCTLSGRHPPRMEVPGRAEATVAFSSWALSRCKCSTTSTTRPTPTGRPVQSMGSCRLLLTPSGHPGSGRATTSSSAVRSSVMAKCSIQDRSLYCATALSCRTPPRWKAAEAGRNGSHSTGLFPTVPA